MSGTQASSNDAKALTELYAEDAVIESPLIPHLLGKQDASVVAGNRFGHSSTRLLPVSLLSASITAPDT
jgi:hypothetical protein